MTNNTFYLEKIIAGPKPWHYYWFVVLGGID
jgi:hypothetical protein